MQKRLSTGRFRYWPGNPAEVSSTLEAHQLQVLLAAGDPAQPGAPAWKRVRPAFERNSKIRRVFRFCLCYSRARMETELKYRGRRVTVADIEFIRRLIADNPRLSRRALSARLCEAWNWRQPNGGLCDMVCRGLMLSFTGRGISSSLPSAGSIPILWRVATRSGTTQPAPVLVDERPLQCTLAEIRPLEFQQVRRTVERTALQ